MNIPPKMKKFLRRRNVSIALLAVLVTVLVAYRVATDDERIRAIAEDYFSAAAGRRVSIGSVSFNLFGPIELRDISVAAPAGSDATSLTAELVSVRHRPWSLLRGRLDVTDVLVVKPVVTVVHRAGPGRPPPVRPAVSFTSLQPGISLHVRDGLIRLAWFGESGDESITQMPVSISVNPQGTGAYRIIFGQDGPGGLRGTARVACDPIRLEQLEASVSVASVLAMLPPPLRDSASQYALAGMLRARAGPVGPNGPTVAIDLEGLSGRSPRSFGQMGVVDLAGRIVVDAVGGLRISRPLTARIPRFGPARLEVRGYWGGFTADAPCRLEAVISDVQLGEQAGGGRMGKIIASVKKQYQPDGRFNVEISYTGKDSFRATIKPDHVSGVYAGFPERVDDITGAIDLTAAGVKFDLTGSRGGGVVTIRGQAGFSDDGKVEVIVDARDIELDEGIRRALPESVKEIWPLLKPTGVVRALTRVRRRGEAGESDVDVTISLDGRTGITFRGFPYPMDGISGIVRVMGDDVQISARGRHGKTPIGVEGWLVGLDGDSPRTDLTIDVSNLEPDEALLAAMAPDARTALKKLHLAGPVSKVVVVATRSGTEPVDYLVSATLKDNSIKPETLPRAITDVAGQVEITPQAVLLKSLTGRYGSAAIDAGGSILFGGAGGMVIENLAVKAVRVEIDDKLLAVLPEATNGLLSQLSLAGRVDIDLDMRHVGSGPGRLDYSLTVQPLGAAATYSGFPYPLQGITGEIIATPRGVDIKALRASCEGGTVRIDGRIATDGPAAAVLTLRAKKLPMSSQLIAAVAKVAPDLAARLEPGGTIGLSPLELTFGKAAAAVSQPATQTSQPTSTSAPACLPWRAGGAVTFGQVRVDIGLGSKTLSGRVSGTASGPALAVDAVLALDSIQVDRRQITNLKGRIRKSPSADIMIVQRIEGSAYGGAIDGQAMIKFTEPASLRAELRVMEIDLSRLVNAGVTDPKKRSDITGRLSGRMWMQANVNDSSSSSRRGAGVISIHQASITKLPVMLELLHLVQLQLPGDTAFTRADVRYSLKGDTISFREIFLQSEVLSLVGSGSMNIRSGRVHLRFLAGPPGKLPRMNQSSDVWIRRLAELVNMIGRKLVVTEVTGTVSNPRRRTVPLPPLQSIGKFVQTMLRPLDEARE